MPTLFPCIGVCSYGPIGKAYENHGAARASLDPGKTGSRQTIRGKCRGGLFDLLQRDRDLRTKRPGDQRSQNSDLWFVLLPRHVAPVILMWAPEA